PKANGPNREGHPADGYPRAKAHAQAEHQPIHAVVERGDDAKSPTHGHGQRVDPINAYEPAGRDEVAERDEAGGGGTGAEQACQAERQAEGDLSDEPALHQGLEVKAAVVQPAAALDGGANAAKSGIQGNQKVELEEKNQGGLVSVHYTGSAPLGEW